MAGSGEDRANERCLIRCRRGLFARSPRCHRPPAAAKGAASLARGREARGSAADQAAAALVPWICDALLSNHSVKAYGRDFLDFVCHMQAQGVGPLEVTADQVKLYKRGLLEAG